MAAAAEEAGVAAAWFSEERLVEVEGRGYIARPVEGVRAVALADE